MRVEDADAADAASVLAGDTAAFENIVARWQHRLLNLAWRFCRDRARAEDITQEVFVKIYRSLASFRGESSFATWATAIAVNTCRSRLRAEGQPLLSLDPERLRSSAPSAAGAYDAAQRDEQVRRAVLTLPERYRDAILVYYFEEKDLAETAGVLQVAEGTMKARLHRARELLRRRMEK